MNEAMAMGGTKTCGTCGSDVPVDFNFCGKCGSRVDSGPSNAAATGSGKTMFFGTNQVPGRAKLIVIKGEGVDGVSYQLAGTEHVAGRRRRHPVPDDP